MSNKTKWTPGPWVNVCTTDRYMTRKGVDLTKYVIYSAKTRGEMAEDGTGTHCRPDASKVDNVEIASAYWGHILDSEANANARLISAAPELYEALEELHDLMQGVIDGDYEPDGFTLQAAANALLKARGETE